MDQAKKEEGVLKWFQEELLPRLVKEGCFGLVGEIEKCDFEMSERGIDHFASSPYFMKLALRGQGEERKEVDILVKFISQDATYRAMMGTDGQFANEAQMYNLVLPSYERFVTSVSPDLTWDMCPVSYHASAGPEHPEKAIIILEDLRSKGFKVAESKAELSIDHCEVALKQLARFHAVSYAMKRSDPDQLDKIKASYQEVRYPENDPMHQEFSNVFQSITSKRAIDYLRAKGRTEVPDDYLEMILQKVTTRPYELMQELVRPKEPLAVICHGDFCRNNVLFRYEASRAVDARLFDFQTYRYASPAIDLSFFFYQNTTLSLREQHFDDLLQLYHSTLISTLSSLLHQPESTLLSSLPLSSFLEDYRQHAVFGFIIASFFVPMMMAPSADPEEFEENFKNKDLTLFAMENYEQGGDVVSERLAEIIIDFYKRGFYR